MRIIKVIDQLHIAWVHVTAVIAGDEFSVFGSLVAHQILQMGHERLGYLFLLKLLQFVKFEKGQWLWKSYFRIIQHNRINDYTVDNPKVFACIALLMTSY